MEHGVLIGSFSDDHYHVLGDDISAWLHSNSLVGKGYQIQARCFLNDEVIVFNVGDFAVIATPDGEFVGKITGLYLVPCTDGTEPSLVALELYQYVQQEKSTNYMIVKPVSTTIVSETRNVARKVILRKEQDSSYLCVDFRRPKFDSDFPIPFWPVVGDMVIMKDETIGKIRDVYAEKRAKVVMYERENGEPQLMNPTSVVIDIDWNDIIEALSGEFHGSQFVEINL